MTFDSQRVIFAAPKWRGSAPFFPMGRSLTLRRIPLCWVRYLGLGSNREILVKRDFGEIKYHLLNIVSFNTKKDHFTRHGNFSLFLCFSTDVFFMLIFIGRMKLVSIKHLKSIIIPPALENPTEYERDIFDRNSFLASIFWNHLLVKYLIKK